MSGLSFGECYNQSFRCFPFSNNYGGHGWNVRAEQNQSPFYVKQRNPQLARQTVEVNQSKDQKH